MQFKEQDLERLSQCPLLTPTGPSHAETCAKALASWALRRAFEGSLKGKPVEILHEIRGKVLEVCGGSGNAGTVARKTAFGLFNLMLDYEVLHLEQPYNLTLAGYTIQGQYALLRKRRGEIPTVLVLYAEEPELRHNHALPPTVPVMARYVHVVTQTKYKDAQILNYPVLKGKPWINGALDLALAKQYLESMIRVASLRPQFPVMGEHCKRCTTKPCLGVFDGRDDDHEGR